MSSVHIIVNGSAGRMGSRICSLARADDSFALVAAVDRADTPHLDRPITPSDEIKYVRSVRKDSRANVVIDFSSDRGALDALSIARETGAALLVGTTGLSSSTIDALRDASRERAVLVTPNTSLGVTILAEYAGKIARSLGLDYAVSITETHHIHKKDAPSGTALRLASAIRDAGGAIESGDIHAIRQGEVIGTHTITFTGGSDVIEVTHRATSRDLFAHGALRAARWLVGKGPGWYTMSDVLG